MIVARNYCSRRNPMSISAASIYLACQMEDARKTQAEICAVTGLTEVTLRKVYKEVLPHLHTVLPAGYQPPVRAPPEEALHARGRRAPPPAARLTARPPPPLRRAAPGGARPRIPRDRAARARGADGRARRGRGGRPVRAAAAAAAAGASRILPQE